MKFKKMMVVLFVWMVPSIAFGAELKVPDDYLDLEEAIAAAEDGDEIVITEDLYGTGNHEVLIDKDLTIEGNDHFIDLSGDYYAFKITDANVAIKNLSFLNGYSVDLVWAGPGQGGALQISYSNVVLDNCTFEHCVSEIGGAVWSIESSLTINRCSFIENHGLIWGGAVYFVAGNLSLVDSIFEMNVADLTGGVLFSIADPELHEATVKGCTFKNNESPSYSVIESWNFKTIKVLNNVISDNSSSHSGPFMIQGGESITFTNNAVLRNSASHFPGGRITRKYSPGTGSIVVCSNTVLENGNEEGSAWAHMWIENNTLSPDQTVVANNIIYSSSLPGVRALREVSDESTILMLRNCLSGPVLEWSTDDIYEDPDLDWKLAPKISSPCVDSAAGEWAALKDFYGHRRHDVGHVSNTGTGTPDYADIGAVEYVEK